MSTAGQTHDVVLETYGSATRTGLNIVRQEGVALYQSTRLPGLPADDLKTRQDSWHLGFGDYLHRSDDPFRYAWSDGVDLRFSNRAQLSPLFSRRLDYLVRNMDAERTTPSAGDTWTVQNSATVTRSTSNTRNSSDACWEIDTGTTADAGIYQALANPTVYRNIAVTWSVFVRTDSTAENIIEAFIQDSGGTTVAALSTADTTYREIRVTRTINGSASFVRVGVQDNSETDRNVQVDGGAIEFAAINDGQIHLIDFEDALYLFCSRAISKWDESDDVFNAVYIDAAEPFTSVAVHRGYLFGAHGSEYTYSLDGATWVDVAPSNGSADYLAQVTDEFGDLRLFRADNPNSIYISTETIPADKGADTAIAAGTWSTQANSLQVGEPDKAFTSLFTAFGTVWAGREEGLFYWYPPTGSFVSATSQFNTLTDNENFMRQTEYIDGWVYVTMPRLGLLRFRYAAGDVGFEQVAPRFLASSYRRFGGRVRALAHEGTWLYALQVSSQGSNESNVLAMKSYGEGMSPWHTLRGLKIQSPQTIITFSNQMYFAGTSKDGDTTFPSVIRMTLPTNHENPMHEETPSVHDQRTGENATFVVTPIHDFAEEGYGEDDKGFIKVRVYAENLNANRTITVYEQRDGSITDSVSLSSAWTAVGSAITSVTAGSATVSFTAGTTGKRIRLAFELNTNATSDGPVLLGYRLYAVPHPDRSWAWEFTASLESSQRSLSGAIQHQTAANILSNLETLDAQDYPLKFYDLDGSSYDVMIRSLSKLAIPRERGPGGSRGAEHLEQAVQIQLREVLTS